MIFEKAIENYAKARKKFYNSLLKVDIANFNEKIERMTGRGDCCVACTDCPVTLARELYGIDHCGALTRREICEILALEVEE